MVAESVAAKIFKIGSVVFELWPFYLITLWSAFVSITKNEHDETTYSESMERRDSQIYVVWWKSYAETIVAESVAEKILKIGSVVFELWPFYLITLCSAFVSITKNEHDETTYSESTERRDSLIAL